VRRTGGTIWLGLANPRIAATLWTVGLPGCSVRREPSLLLITIDTLRADHLSTYAYPRPTSPRLDALAARGITFEDVFSTIPETGPSFSSLLTGRWPAEMGLRGNGHPLDPRFATLATLLSAAGYRTGGFVSGFPLTRRLSGLQRGFDDYDDRMPDPRGSSPNVQRLAPGTTDAALAWLQENKAAPFFMWVHYYDAHGDYAPGAPYDTMFTGGADGPRLSAADIPAYQRRDGHHDAGYYIDRYDGEIRKVDDQISRLLQALERDGLTDSTVVVVTSDHGESLTEHGYYLDHGNELYGPSLRVPLVMAGPGIPADGRRFSEVVRLPDLMPTILEVLGQPVPGDMPAVSLASWWDGATAVADRREALSEARFQPYRALTPGADVGPKLSARDERYTFILRLDGPRSELYDRLSDPAERHDLLAGAAQDPGLAALAGDLGARLRQRLARAGGGEPAATVFTPDIRLRLDRLAAQRAGN
jgi:arylsulfatase A-like enzyme